MKTQVIKNDQITKIEAKNLERPAKSSKYDTTIDERLKTYESRKAEPRLTEYR